jgi:hypothetical protein
MLVVLQLNDEGKIMSESSKRWWQTMPWSERPRGQKIGMIVGWGVIALVLVSVLFELNEEQDLPAAQAVAEIPPAPTERPAEPESKPEHKKPLDLAKARLFAKGTLRIINEAEQSLNDGIQLGDVAGIAKHVQRPLQAELEQWPSLVERQPNDQREHFSYCHDAAMRLQTLSYAVQRERTVESMKYLRKDDAEYRNVKQQCEQQLAATDGQIKAAITAEDAELKKKFGGRECLKVFTLDKNTGQVIEVPRPPHCKQ